MKVLAVTGRLAQDMVRGAARDADVLVLDVDVAAFITPEMLQRAAVAGYDLILIPGAITADFQEAERVLGAKIRLGPKHAADLGFVLKHLNDIELSRTIPACVLLENTMRKNAAGQAAKLETEASFDLTLRDAKIGGSSRMKVLAEIVDATKMSVEALSNRIHYYEEEGADMIDLGLPLDARPPQVIAALKVARKATDLPLSIDTVRMHIKGIYGKLQVHSRGEAVSKYFRSAARIILTGTLACAGGGAQGQGGCPKGDRIGPPAGRRLRGDGLGAAGV